MQCPVWLEEPIPHLRFRIASRNCYAKFNKFGMSFFDFNCYQATKLQHDTFNHWSITYLKIKISIKLKFQKIKINDNNIVEKLLFVGF